MLLQLKDKTQTQRRTICGPVQPVRILPLGCGPVSEENHLLTSRFCWGGVKPDGRKTSSYKYKTLVLSWTRVGSPLGCDGKGLEEFKYIRRGCGGAQGGCLSGEETPWTGLGLEELAEVAWGEEYLGLPAEAVAPCGPKPGSATGG